VLIDAFAHSTSLADPRGPGLGKGIRLATPAAWPARNAAKHAHASNVRVEVDTGEGDTVLRVLVRDDGRGGADLSGGTGLVGLNDRVEALSGKLSVQTERGAGTTLRAELPLHPDPCPQRLT
jgi:glucose-6-phosphate-specific signal transduction histidine kinase